MATYFHGSSDIQAAAAPSDGIQTLYLMNPNYLSSYSDATPQQQQSPNMIFFNHGGAAASNNSLSHGPPQNHHFVGIPLPVPSSNITSLAPDNHSRPSSLHGVIPGAHYNIWGSIDQNSIASAATASESSGAHDVMSSQVGFRRPLVVSPGRQGLSLSLSSQQAPAPPTSYSRAISHEHEIQALHPHVSVVSSGDEIRLSGTSPPSVSAVSNGFSGMHNMILGSRYLRATQELLDEVANVGKDLIKSGFMGRTKEKMKMTKESVTGDGSDGSGEAVGETSAKRGADLTTAHRHELQMKRTKLVNMLDEVDQRYRQYHHQMQVVVSSFEQAAGFGAAKSYTALALQTISRQFRSLKDTISSQIRATSKSLGEEDCIGARAEGSRLRHVDHQLRQQRALQQLGMAQHNAWRPQRGLPERAVSVLRAWLFEHFLHPYPKDSDKHMLAKQTGLTRSQVSNWFINARVRLWKPMVEEMYLEETKEREKAGSEETGSKNENKESGSQYSSAPGETSTLHMDQLKGALLRSKQPEKPTNQNTNSPTKFSNPTISMSPMGASFQQQSGFTLIGPAEMEEIAQRSSKKPRAGDMQNSPSSILSMDMDMKQGETSREIGVSFGGERLSKDGYPLITGSNGSFGAYPMGDLGRFNIEQLTPRFSGNSTVSLTLGLPHLFQERSKTSSPARTFSWAVED
uniref:Homeobox domain-containing protein n=1 Tax=Salix viminalis TaxID=40686 RepID=A0A6N2MKG3_SALVM